MAETIGSLFAQARHSLQAAGIDGAAQDARLLVCGLLGLDATAFLTRNDSEVAATDVDRVHHAIARRAGREPVHRILGQREFFGLMLGLSTETLEPRPDTEVLVERLLPFAERIVADKGSCRIVDLGTGTGAICLALLETVPQATGLGTDISRDALAIAGANAVRNNLAGRFSTLESSWFAAVEGRFDIVVSNPPYIRTSVMASLAPEVRDHDPAAALDGGPDGLDAYRAIADGSADHLADNGVIGLEIGFDQHESVKALFEERGFHLVDQGKDLGGNDRVLVFRHPAGP